MGGPFTVEKVQEFIASQEDVNLELREVAPDVLLFYSHGFSSSKLTVQFESPQFDHALKRLQELWNKQIEESSPGPDGSVPAPCGSGLSYVNTATPFLDVMRSLENTM